MLKYIRFILAFVIVFSQIPVPEVCTAQDGLFGKIAQSDEPIVVKGDKIEYFHDQKKVSGVGNVSITYGDVKLTCDKISVYTDTKEAVCEGNVKISQPGAAMEGDKINYNFSTKKGYALESSVQAKPFYAGASLVEQTGDKDFRLEKGYATTCDLNSPHYRIEAKSLAIFLERKIVAKHIVFYVGEVPVFYLPIYVQPLGKKFPEVTITPGRTTDWGYYALTAWRVYFNEASKGFVRLDYREKKGLSEGADYQYETEDFGKGVGRVYYTHENDALTITKEDEKAKNRWRIQYRHELDLAEDTTCVLAFNKLSDKDIIKNYLYREYEEDPLPDSYVIVQTAKPNYVFTLFAKKRFNDFFDVVERLPEAKIEINNQRLWNTNFYYQSESSTTNFVKTYDEKDDHSPDESLRMDTLQKLSYAARLFRFLNVTPFAATRQTFYSRNRWKETSRLRSIYEWGVEVSTRFHRVFDVYTDLWGLDINKLKHIMAPYVKFLHRRNPSISPSNLYQFDEVDAIEYYNGFELFLESKLQTKRQSGTETQVADLARFTVGSEYTFRQKKNFFGFKGVGKFGDVRFTLEMWPYSWLSIDSKMILDDKDCRLNSADLDVYVNFGEKFTLGAGQRYESTGNETTSQLSGEMFYNFNDDWKCKIYQRFDWATAKWLEQEYTIFKDLHCWIAEFTFDIRNDDYTAWLIFRLKAFPDVPIGLLKTTYRRPEPGHRR